MWKYSSASHYLGIMLLAASFLSAGGGAVFYMTSFVVFLEWELLSFFSSSIVMVVLLDWMSLTFMGLVTFISSVVLLYSYYYMGGDKYLYRFIFLVYLFVLSMLFMIMSPNMISILLGWDGLGLVSYCLVIYYQGVKSANAGMLTILSNRVGDVAILLSISWALNFGSWGFNYIQYMLQDLECWFILFMVILAGMTKSAQIPFSAWLPAAMAAPTPVSALVHSSTLVTAGVYLLIRFHEMLGVNGVLFYTGCLTMFMSGLGANLEMDLKKVIALSTLSQLGVMMFSLSLGLEELAFFHLMTHALFKSLLFLCAGVFIHGAGDAQDVRLLGGAMKSMPVSSVFFVCCSMSLCGFPFLSGFYSKDLILESYMLGEMGALMGLVVAGGTFFTISYSLRLSGYLFLKNLGVKPMNQFGENVGMLFPMGVLYSISVVAGAGFSWMNFPFFLILLPVGWKIFLLVGTLILLLTLLQQMLGEVGLNFVSGVSVSVLWFFGSMWFLPYLSVGGATGGLLLGLSILKNVDQGWMEELGGQGAISAFNHMASKVDYSFFSGMKMYLFSFFILVFVFLYYF